MLLDPFADYLRDIEMPQALQGRIAYLCEEFITLIPGDINTLFVTDGYDDEKVRRYKSVYLVSGNILSELKEFVVADNIDFVNLRQSGIELLDVTKEKLEIVSGKTTIDSRLKVRLQFRSGMGLAAEFEAVHNNCLYLWDFLRKIFMPHV